MNTMIGNLINGNVSTARKQANRFSQKAIVDELTANYGWTNEKALRCALFLKTGEGWQEYCDCD